MKTKRLRASLLWAAWVFASIGFAEERGSAPVTGSPGRPDRAVAVEGRCPTFIWGQVEGSGGYEVVAYEAGSGAQGHKKLALRETVSAGIFAWAPPADQCLRPGRYAWSVRARIGDGWTDWSQPRLFEVKGQDTVPAADAEFRQAVVEVARWLREERPSPAEADARAVSRESPPMASLSSDAVMTSWLPEPAIFTPVPCQAGSEVFADVPASHPFCAWIEQIYRDRITSGCGTNPLQYCPGNFVTRGQMAVFLERVLHLRDPEVEAGRVHTCGLLSNRHLVCWGSNIDGQSTPPAGTFTQVSGGEAHTCGVKSDGAAACWGRNSEGQSTPPAGTFTQVSGGGVHTCGVKSDGTVACWGRNIEGQSTPPAGTFTQVSAGGLHTCGVRSDGTAACWGSNTDGQSTPPPRFP